MENSFFILSDKDLTIERFHICSWDFKDRKSFIELGFEIDNSTYLKNVELIFTAPFLNNISKDKVTCLAKKLSDSANSRFIFNDTIVNSPAINGDGRGGVTLKFQIREDDLTVLPIDDITIVNDKEYLKLNFIVPQEASTKIYCRILIQLPINTISISKEGFSKSMHIFDIKVNEQRNLPDEVFTIQRSNNLKFCKINHCFCFHIVPDTFEISFVDDKKLKNIRELEYSAFKKYLPEQVKGLKKEEHIIVFCKSSNENSYTFFSTFNKEILGSGQIIFTLAANIFCALLLFIATNEKYSLSNLSAVPTTIWISGLIFLLLIGYMGYLLLPPLVRILWKKIQGVFNKS